MMRLKSWIFGILLLPLGSLAHAANAEERQALEFMQKSFSELDVARVSQISQKMALTDAVAEKFWPRYRDYLHAQIALRDRQLASLARYADLLHRDLLDNVNAAALLRESMTQEEKHLTNRQRFIRQMDEILGPQQQIRLYQMELLLDAQFRSPVLAQVPLAE